MLPSEFQPSDLERAAVKGVLEAADLSPDQIDALIVYSLVPDELHPLNHSRLVEVLGLRDDVLSFSLSASCASFVTQLYTAAKLIDGERIRHVVIVQSAVMSRLMDYASPSSLVGGDGATAALVSASAAGSILGYEQRTHGELHAGLRVFSPSDPDKAWYETDGHRTPLAFTGADPELSQRMGTRPASAAREVCAPLLSRLGLHSNDIAFFATSQPTPWFSRACADALEIPHDRTLDTFPEYAHLMPSSAPMNLLRAQERGLVADGDIVLVCSPWRRICSDRERTALEKTPTRLVELGEERT